jgi:hypothetical protein
VSAAGGIVYDASLAGNPTLSTHSFGGTITSTNGPFTVRIPNGIIRGT